MHRPSRDRPATACRARLVALRIGLVLAANGGVQGTLAPLFRLGLGGRIGDGRQGMSWIHMDDMVAIIMAALDDPRWTGPINAVAPEPVSNRVFTAALADALNRPAVLLSGQMVQPRRLRSLDYRWRHPELGAALRA